MLAIILRLVDDLPKWHKNRCLKIYIFDVRHMLKKKTYRKFLNSCKFKKDLFLLVAYVALVALLQFKFDEVIVT